ncbi:putative PurR-regulated permease PerM [Aminobacter aminovorans]|uniref:Pheromone autoinducer 2 transporter n=1 Tax=Aminobacter aminovorans TaxID=83263 RepID=A0A380WFP1_AMIAI|nr:putative PurR-regulated permease PerM [Aminobacter aminovorans]SUU87817.1 pheromone autoinducer 2 transporter [Aminobacter aminovorans]
MVEIRKGQGVAEQISLQPAARTVLPPFAATAAMVAILYFARDVLLPLAIAILITFALAPIVSWLRRLGVPRLVSVIACVIAAFGTVAIFSFVVASQIGEVAQNLPTYQSNILEKVRSLKETGGGNGIIDRLSGVIERVGQEIDKPEGTTVGPAQPSRPDPLLVEIFTPQRPIETLMSLILPLIGPLATAGLVIVVVIFMLLEREDLRDRFIRLVGYGDLHRTTEALQDAGRRVGQYLLMQLVVNVAYGVPIGIGLWLLGIPNAVLWGLLAIVLRFVPYIGPAIAMILPLFLALAVAPGWSLVLWAAALFIVMELIINNVIEPWLYGSRTGLSPLAIIVAAIFWTWLWGPVGLVLSTPLTVCLVVLGKHVPQFAFLEVLFGNEPVLDPKERLYQRLLAGDPEEATDHAEEMLETEYLVDFYGSVAIPALLLGERDRARGALTDEQRRRVAASAATLVANLNEIANEEAEEGDDVAAEDAAPDERPEEDELPDGSGKSVLCIGGRGDLDNAAAAMLAQVLTVQGASASTASHTDVDPANIRNLPLGTFQTAVVGFLNSDSLHHGRYVVRRLKRAGKGLRVGIVLWADAAPGRDAEKLAAELNADFVAYDMMSAATGALSDTPPIPLKAPKRMVRRQPASRGKPATKAKAPAG